MVVLVGLGVDKTGDGGKEKKEKRQNGWAGELYRRAAQRLPQDHIRALGGIGAGRNMRIRAGRPFRTAKIIVWKAAL